MKRGGSFLPDILSKVQTEGSVLEDWLSLTHFDFKENKEKSSWQQLREWVKANNLRFEEIEVKERGKKVTKINFSKRLG